MQFGCASFVSKFLREEVICGSRKKEMAGKRKEKGRKITLVVACTRNKKHFKKHLSKEKETEKLTRPNFIPRAMQL